jgi:uncharacterized protein (TIGR03066 family)
MRWFHCLLVSCLALVLPACGSTSATAPSGTATGTTPTSAPPASSADKGEVSKKEPTNAEKIIGSWELVKSAAGTPPGVLVELTKDGKVKISTKSGKVFEATYTVDGNKFTVSGKSGKKDTSTIKKLRDTELVTETADGKVEEYKRK